MVPLSRKKSAMCTAPEFSPVNSSTSSVQESSDWVKRRMYRLEKFMRVSYDGFKQEVSDLFSAIESSRKHYKGTSGYFKKGRGSGVKGVTELLNLSCSVNYDPKRNPYKHQIFLVLWQGFYSIMNLKIIKLNVRELNDAGKRLNIGKFLKTWKPDTVCLQETKMKQISVGLVRGGEDLSPHGLLFLPQEPRGLSFKVG